MMFLKPGDSVEIIAPSSKRGTLEDSETLLKAGCRVLKEWGLVPQHSASLFAPHPFYAAPTPQRLENFLAAVTTPETRVLWALRGGCGATRLIPFLESLSPYPSKKILIGFSDLTALHLFTYQRWGWTALHGPALGQMAGEALGSLSKHLLRDLLFGKIQKIILEDLDPINDAACSLREPLTGPLTGGNLSVVTYGLGTSWQLQSAGHILCLEDVNERAYRTAERLEHLRQAGIFKEAKGIVLGEFDFQENRVASEERPLYPGMLKEFAESVRIPVFTSSQFGHGQVNKPFILGAQSQIKVLKHDQRLQVEMEISVPWHSEKVSLALGSQAREHG